MPDSRKTVEVVLDGQNRMQTAVDQATAGMRTFADRTVGHLQRAVGAVINLQNILVAGTAAVAARSIFQPAIEMETYRTQFAVLLGSLDTAEQRMRELERFAASTPFELPGIARASRVLEVLTRGALSTGNGLRLVGDVAAGVNQPIEELAIWFGRLYDGISANRPVGEALMRLQELGVVSGEVRGRIEELQKTGASSRQVWQVVEQAVARFSGQMDVLSRTTAGRLSTLRDNWTAVRRTVGEAALPALSEAVAKLIQDLERLQATGELQRWGKEVGEAITGLYEKLKALAQFLADNRDTLKTLAFTYAGVQVVRAAAGAVNGLRFALAAMMITAGAAEKQTQANAAANVALAGSANTAAGAVGGLKIALAGLGLAAAAAGIAAIVREVMLLNEATADLNRSIDATGDNKVGVMLGYQRDAFFESWRGKHGTYEGAADAWRKEAPGRKARLEQRYADAWKPSAPGEAAAPEAGTGAGLSDAPVVDQDALKKAQEKAREEYEKAQEQIAEARRRLAEMDADSAADAAEAEIDAQINAWKAKEDALRGAAAQHAAAVQGILDKAAGALDRARRTPDERRKDDAAAREAARQERKEGLARDRAKDALGEGAVRDAGGVWRNRRGKAFGRKMQGWLDVIDAEGDAERRRQRQQQAHGEAEGAAFAADQANAALVAARDARQRAGADAARQEVVNDLVDAELTAFFGGGAGGSGSLAGSAVATAIAGAAGAAAAAAAGAAAGAAGGDTLDVLRAIETNTRTAAEKIDQMVGLQA